MDQARALLARYLGDERFRHRANQATDGLRFAQDEGYEVSAADLEAAAAEIEARPASDLPGEIDPGRLAEASTWARRMALLQLRGLEEDLGAVGGKLQRRPGTRRGGAPRGRSAG
jgi:hypothetical protein